MIAAAPGSSGARVTIATPAWADHPAMTAGAGAAMCAAACAPRRAGAIIGPSRWRPSGRAPTHPGGGPAAERAERAVDHLGR